jgi:hypothetical protein
MQAEVQVALDGEEKWLKENLDKVTHLNLGEDEANCSSVSGACGEHEGLSNDSQEHQSNSR